MAIAPRRALLSLAVVKPAREQELSIRAHERQVHRFDADGHIDLDIALVVLITGHALELLAMPLEPAEVGPVIVRGALDISRTAFATRTTTGFVPSLMTKRTVLSLLSGHTLEKPACLLHMRTSTPRVDPTH